MALSTEVKEKWFGKGYRVSFFFWTIRPQPCLGLGSPTRQPLQLGLIDDTLPAEWSGAQRSVNHPRQARSVISTTSRPDQFISPSLALTPSLARWCHNTLPGVLNRLISRADAAEAISLHHSSRPFTVRLPKPRSVYSEAGRTRICRGHGGFTAGGVSEGIDEGRCSELWSWSVWMILLNQFSTKINK